MVRKNKTLGLLLVISFLTSLFVFCSAAVKAQTSNNTLPPANQWQKLYGSGTTQQVSNLIQTSDGGYAFLDSGGDYQFLLFPVILFKVDSLGNEQWNKTITHFTAADLIQTSDGGYEIAGEWSNYGNTEGIPYQATPTLIKLNSKGDIQWYENTSAVLNLAKASSDIQTSDGGFAYFEPANANVFPTLTSFPILVKTNSNNETQWIENFTYSGPANYHNGTITFPFKISSIIETSDGALACLGIADAHLQPQGLWGYVYLVKTAPFLPQPSRSPLPTALPTPTQNTITITANEEILIIATMAVAVALGVILLTYRKHQKPLT